MLPRACCLSRFLSTPSARRATAVYQLGNSVRRFLSTPSARRATTPPVGGRAAAKISIHALREEGDTSFCSGSTISSRFLSTPSARRATGCSHGCRYCFAQFLSTPSARRATKVAPYVFLAVHISIHALREEGDLRPAPQPAYRSHFYPRPPRGGRPVIDVPSKKVLGFLSTPSARRATR